MDRFSFDGSGKKLIYQEALEFMGEVKAGISWERFSTQAVRYSDALIDILNEAEPARNFLSGKGISIEYIQKHLRDILIRLHFNPKNDHYLTLFLPRTASLNQIHKRWKDLMLIYHPDRNSSADAARCAKQINAAYDILKNPEKKKEYDMRTTMTGDTYLRIHPGSTSHRRRPARYPFISPGLRRLLPKLIIPCSILISLAILLTIFLNNRQDRYLPQTKKAQPLRQQSAHIADVPAYPREVRVQPETQQATPSEMRIFYREGSGVQPRRRTAGTEIAGASRSRAARVPNQMEKSLKVVPVAPEGKSRLREIELASGNVPAFVVQDKAPKKEMAAVPPRGSSDKQPGSLPGQKGAGPEDEALNAKLSDLETEVFFFMVQYVHAYEEGDISKFMAFFSRSAIENGNMRYDDIRESYKKNFENGRYSYVLKNVSISKKDDAITVTGDYSIKRLGGDMGPAINGRARWSLGRVDGGLKITRIDYDKH